MEMPPAVAEYLLALPDDQRSTLQLVYDRIAVVLPLGAGVGISWGVIMFNYEGMLLGIGAASRHCSLYMGTERLKAELGSELAAYDMSKGTIRFPSDQAPPAELLASIVRIKVEENLARKVATGAAKAARSKAAQKSPFET